MVIYVAHEYGGKQENRDKADEVLKRLQTSDLENTYISPIQALSYLPYNSIGFDKEIALCLDLLSICDRLIVASNVSKGVQAEIDFAKLVGMEIVYL